VRIARNLAVSELRRAKRAEPIDDDTPGDAPRAPDPMLREAIAACRDKLPPKPRLVLDTRLAGGRDDDELAASLDMKLNTFLQNFTRARQLLAECLKSRGIVIALELSA
jgi:DNA-directed RNA polymerase specialized sigma24 family protein